MSKHPARLSWSDNDVLSIAFEGRALEFARQLARLGTDLVTVRNDDPALHPSVTVDGAETAALTNVAFAGVTDEVYAMMVKTIGDAGWQVIEDGGRECVS